MISYTQRQLAGVLAIAVLSWIFGFFTGNYWKQDLCCVYLQQQGMAGHVHQPATAVGALAVKPSKPVPSTGAAPPTGALLLPPAKTPPLGSKTSYPSVPGLTFKTLSSATLDKSLSPTAAEAVFYEYLRHVDVSCSNHKRLGHAGDGGWDVCMAAPFQPGPNCLVYSFGISNDWSFDDTISNSYGCTVRAFDPSINLGHHVRGKKKLIHFFHRGLSGANTERRGPRGLVWVLRTFDTFVKDCGDSERIIDFLKIDVEAAEWGALRTMLVDGSLRRVKQIGFEIHTKELGGSRQSTSVAQFGDFFSILRELEKLGFRKWHTHSNPMGMYTSRRTRKKLSCCFELIYINANYIGFAT